MRCCRDFLVALLLVAATFLAQTNTASATASAAASSVALLNTAKALDTNGRVVEGEDGTILQGADGTYHWFLMRYGDCTFVGCQPGGQVNSSVCGFRTNHSVVLYTSRTLASGSWVGPSVALAPVTDPLGVLFRPKVLLRADGTAVLWVRSVPYTAAGSALNWTDERYMVATSKSLDTPFTLVSTRVAIHYLSGGDYDIFLDGDAGYLVYTSHNSNVRISVEALDRSLLASTNISSGAFGPTPVEAPAMFKRNGVYYVTFGHTCCYCTGGSNVAVWASRHPLGPYVALAEIGETAGLPTMAAQQNFVFVTGGGDYVWSGTRWGSAPDQAMDRDLPAWALLAWDDTVSPAVPRNLTRLPVVYVTP